MAAQSQSNSPLADFGALVRRQLWSILLPFAFITSVGVMIAELMPRRYDVTTTIKVPESGMPGTLNEIQRDVSAAQNDMKAEPLVRSVIEAQEWPDYVGLTEKEKIDYVQRVIKNTKPVVRAVAKNSAGSSYIIVLYNDSEGSRAERFLNQLRDRYIQSVVAGVRADAVARRDALKELRDDYFGAYKDAEKAKADLIKAKNLSTSAPPNGPGGTRGLDPIYERLLQSEAQLAVAEQALLEETARLEYTQKLFSVELESIPETPAAAALANAGQKPAPVDDTDKQIRDLDLEILDLREKQKDYRPAATAYQRIEEDIEKAENRKALLQGESGISLQKTASTRFVPNPRRADYEQQIRTSESKIAGLKVSVSSLTATIAELRRDHAARAEWYLQLSYLAQDVVTANTNYLNADGDYQSQLTRVALLQGALADPFEVVEVAKASEIPNSPNVPIFILISSFIGLACGLGWAMASEFLRNGYRGTSDLTRGLATPVLGVINSITTRVQVRRTWTRHIMIAVSSIVIVGSILWITWAYQHDSLRLLGPRLTQLIEDIRMAFRP